MSTTRSQAPPLYSPAPPPRGRQRHAVSLVALAAICSLAFALQLYHFSPYMTDDAYISLRYSERLLHGQGLTWNSMRPAVEGYTNLLWVLLCAALGAVGMRLEWAAQALGIASTAATVAAVVAQVYRDFPAKIRFLSALMGGLALCLSAPVAVWALGGLEQPLLAALLAWAAYFGLRWVAVPKGASSDANSAGILLAVAVLTRADAALLAALFYAGAVLADGVRPRSLIARARLLLFPVIAFLGQEVFRRAYYGQWLPNTAYVKVAFTLHRLRTGLKYDFMGVRSEFVFMGLVLVGCVALWIAGKRRQVLFLLTPALGWLFYIFLVGGDIFPAYRHFVPAMALMAFLIAGCGMLTLSAPFRFSQMRVAVFLTLTALVLTSDFFAPLERWEQDGRSVGLFLRQAFASRHPLLSSDPAGAVPFYAEMEAIDPLGLNDYHIARHSVAVRGRGWVGHELGDGKYVLDRKPDLLVLSDLNGVAAFPADQQLLADPRFPRLYQRLVIDAGQPHPVRAVLYIRRLDGPLGIQVASDHESIPGYLATSQDNNAVKLVDGQAQLVIAAHGTAEFASVPLRTGTWKSALTGAGAAQLRLKASPGAGDCAACVHAGPDQTVSITVENMSDQPAVLRSVELTPAG